MNPNLPPFREEIQLPNMVTQAKGDSVKNTKPFEVTNPNNPDYFRERVDNFMFGRLNNCREDEVAVPDWLYEGIMYQISPLVDSIAQQRLVQGFTSEDLRSFMGMKVHQVLRRRQFDLRKAPGPFFKAVFNNMFNDLNKMKDNALKGDFSADCLDFRSDFPDDMQAVFDETPQVPDLGHASQILDGLLSDADSEEEMKRIFSMFFE